MNETVFAYGSNMCSGRFHAYAVSPIAGGRAGWLGDYRLRFNKFSHTDGSGKANVEAHPGSQVWGVLYHIPETDLKPLDAGEGGYRRVKLPVHMIDGEITEAWVYLAMKPRNDPALRPYSWYKRFLVEGAKEHALPPEYIVELERIEATQDPDQQREQEKRMLAIMSLF